MEDETFTKAIYIANNEIIEFDNYEISNYGNVRRCYKNGKIKELKLSRQPDRYIIICLHKNNKTIGCYVHRLVLSSFQTDQYFHGAVVDHINSIKDDNRLINLRWVTQKENNNTEHHKKCLSKAKKGKICGSNNPMFGKKHSDETKKKLSGSNNPNAQSCIYDNREFGSIREAYNYAIENGLFDKCYDTFWKMIKNHNKY